MQHDSDTELDDALRRQLELRVGRTLCRRYTLEALLGIGGMASVYRGTHRNGHCVAVKVLHQQFSLSQDIRERFLREGYVANKVDHPGAVRVLDDDTAEDGEVFLVMELLEGETLEQLMVRRGGRIAAPELVPIACEILDVLAAAHAKGIVHRDIKPDNIFIERNGAVKVLDFGIARLNDGSRTATRTGRVLGTPAYMAPEQARGETKLVDGRTDTWAVGAICFRGLVGTFVHEASTAELMMIYSATRPVRPLREAQPTLEPQVAEIIDRSLAMAIEDRWPTAKAMATAFRSLSREELLGASSAARRYEQAVDKTQPVDTAPMGAPARRTDIVETTQPLDKPLAGANLAALSFDDDDDHTEQAATLASPAVAAAPRAPATTAGLERSVSQATATRQLGLRASAGALVLVTLVGATLLIRRSLKTEDVVPALSVALGSSTASSAPSVPVVGTEEAVPGSGDASASAQPSSRSLLPAPSSTAPSSAALPVRQPAPAVALAKTSTPAPTPAPSASVCAPNKVLTADGAWQWRMECTAR